MIRTFKRLLGPTLVLLIFCGAVWLLSRQLEGGDLKIIAARLHDLLTNSAGLIVVAVGLTAINYIVLIGYDLLAVRWVGENLSLRRIALASFAGYTCGYNFGSTLAGTSVRYRLYAAWGIPTLKILQLLVILGLTFWFGLFALAGVVFLIAPPPIPAALNLPFASAQWFGGGLLLMAVVYLGMAAWHQGSVQIWRWRLPVPPFKLSLYQVLIASADFLLVAGVLYVLWPASAGMSYPQVLGIYMLAFVAGVLTHVPGGYGVMEAIIASFIVDDAVRNDVLASWLLFRVIYYLIPLMIAAVLLGWYELYLSRRQPQETPGHPLPQPSSNGRDETKAGQEARRS